MSSTSNGIASRDEAARSDLARRIGTASASPNVVTWGISCHDRVRLRAIRQRHAFDVLILAGGVRLPGLAGVADHRQDCTHGDGLPLGGAVVQHHTGPGGEHPNNGLFGFQFHDRFVYDDLGADRDQPTKHHHFGQSIPDVGEQELECHVCLQDPPCRYHNTAGCRQVVPLDASQRGRGIESRDPIDRPPIESNARSWF